jgi:FixJ family two-component response regulator
MMKKKSHIYIVDDDDSICRALSRLAASDGLRIDAFSSAEKFLDSVPHGTKGILILDIRMPGMDGFQLQEILNKRHSPLHIIFITGHAQANDREYALQCGAHGFLVKPFNDKSLLDLIHMGMEKDRVAGE